MNRQTYSFDVSYTQFFQSLVLNEPVEVENDQSTFSIMDTNIIFEAIKDFPLKDSALLMQVSRSMYRVIGKVLCLQQSAQFIAPIIEHYCMYKKITALWKNLCIYHGKNTLELNLSHPSIAEADLYYLYRFFPNVTKISLRTSMVTLLEPLTLYKQLRVLDISCCFHISQNGFSHIKNCTSLEELYIINEKDDIQRNAFGISSLEPLKRLQLKKLTIAYVHSLKARGFEPLLDYCTTLNSLCIHSVYLQRDTAETIFALMYGKQVTIINWQFVSTTNFDCLA